MSTGDRSLIAALPGFLTWEAGSGLVRSACSIYVRWIYGQLRAWSDATDPRIFEAATGLPRPIQQRLLLAPSLFHLLQSKPVPGDEEVDSLRQFIRTEQYLCDQTEEYPANSWTALGDYYLPARKASPRVPSPHWSEEAFFQAPAIGHIVLDGYSPYSSRRFPQEFGDLVPHSADQIEVIKQKIEQSLGHIETVSPTARVAVDSSVQTLTVMRAPSHTNMTSSMSLRSMIGRVGLVNLNSDRWTVNKISNAIIHEAIHSLIYKIELQSGLYTDEAASQTVMTVSPWSGRNLQLHSFVHACFVWFGLWCFWDRSLKQGRDGGGLMSRAFRGYAEGSPLEGISREAVEAIQPDVRLAIEEMSEYVARNAA